MKIIKYFEEFTKVEYQSSDEDNDSYKNDHKKRKRKKLGIVNNIKVLPNKVKDVIQFKLKY